MVEFVKYDEIEEKESFKQDLLKKLEAFQLLFSLMIIFNCIVIIADKLFFNTLEEYWLLHAFNVFVVFQCMENSKRWINIKKNSSDKIIIKKIDK